MLDRLFIAPSRLRPSAHFVLAGAQYPASILAALPPNVTHIVHVNPADHPALYSSCAWQVKVTRGAMRHIGWSPSVTLFEATACGAPIISDRWPGFDSFFAPGEEALVADSTADVLAALDLPEEARLRIAAAGRARVLREHTYVQRVDQLEAHLRFIP
jgi:spore maturation protein CgeB